jgi:hypothetical protein
VINGQRSPGIVGYDDHDKDAGCGAGGTADRRIRAAWAAAHAPAAGVSPWARVAACAVPFTVLPSSAWRLVAVAAYAPLLL